jgi:hypothetical protein
VAKEETKSLNVDDGKVAAIRNKIRKEKKKSCMLLDNYTK